MAPSFIPSELRLSRQADLAVEQALVKGGAGLVACGLASFVLFGTRSSRLAFATLGMGFGLGDAFRTCSIAFENESKQEQ